MSSLRLRIAFVLVACAALALSGNGPSHAASAGAAQYIPSTQCQQCHPEIYKAWRESEHATSFTQSEFLIPYERIRRANPARAASCDHCHNPMRFVLGPDDPKASIFAQEGVPCEFCHSVESVNPAGPFPRYRTRAGVMFGPIEKTSRKKTHVTQFSPLHITSDFCAGCHEFRNEYGVPILTTVSEWKESFYRGEQVHCQFCHLPELFDARFIDPEGRRRKGPSDHGMVGGKSREMLAKAIPMRASLRLSGSEAVLTVSLKNETVGHKTPSGMPLHRIRLASVLYDAKGNALDRKEEVFERVIGDGAGRRLELPEQVFLDGREVLKDNRIGPKEVREVQQRFSLRGGAPATAAVSLTYELPTPDVAPRLRMIEIPIARLNIPAAPDNRWMKTALVILSIVSVGAVGALLLLRNRKG